MSADTLPPLDETKAGRLTIQYSPTPETEIVENPPRFTWIPVIEDDATYILRVSPDPEFSAADTRVFKGIRYNFFTPDAAMPPGSYFWCYATWDAETETRTSGWSAVRSFALDEGLPETALPSRTDRLSGSEKSHPRLWMTTDRLSAFKAAIEHDPNHCTWADFYENAVVPWMKRDVMTEPAGYPNHQRVAAVWRQTYIDLQEMWYAIRNLAIGGKATGNAEMTARAKEWLLEAASWDPRGVTSRAYTDEWAYRVCNALAWSAQSQRQI
jgi:hypothetical protein